MKSLRNIAAAALLTIGAFTTIIYTSCTKDACKDVVCNNGGTCVSGSCSCPTGYEGTNCQTYSRDKFIGVYVGNETCTVGTDSYTITIAANSDNVKVTMTNLYNQSFTATGTMTGANSFNFDNTQGGTHFTGTGTLSGNQLTVTYQITSTAANNACTFIGNK